MVDDDKDFSFGDGGEDFADDDGWGSLEDDTEGVDEAGEDFDLGSLEKESDSVHPLASSIPVAEKSAVAAADDSAAEKVRSTPSRIVWYGVLVMVLSAAGFYYFTTSPAPPVAKGPAPAKQTVAMPERPDPSAMPAIPESEPVEAVNTPAVEAPIPRGTLREVLPSESAPATSVAEVPPAAPVDPVMPASPPEVAVVAAKSEVPAAVAKKKATVASEKHVVVGKYTIQAGAFVDHVHRDQVLAKISQLGYKGKVIPVKKVMPMTRLLIGVYAQDVAEQKVKSLAKTIPGVFSMRRGDGRAVYAGSYYEIDKARIFADELSKQGIVVKEEPAEVELTLSRLRFGSFPDEAKANKAARQARDIGLEVEVVGTP